MWNKVGTNVVPILENLNKLRPLKNIMFQTSIFYLTIINIIFLLGLGTLYTKNFIHIKSSFTVGLLLFTSIFLIQNIASLYIATTQMKTFATMAELHVLILTGLQTLAFFILNIISWR